MKYLDIVQRGRFIVIYGPNNVGKSTQIDLLSKKLITQYHIQIMILKYPIYTLEPTGPQLYQIIKKNKNKQKITDLELQALYAQNRRDFQTTLESCLKAGINVVAEDYIGTGLAWGVTKGLPLKSLLKVNNYLLTPDLSILMDGKRFVQAIEKGHIFEDSPNEIWNKNREIHLNLAEKFKWNIVKSDDTVEKVHKNIWEYVSKEMDLSKVSY
ncbi:hypothetical protein JXA34_01435 [Patescibacteria group bacterium]|nr:hypothetical protein [Patescibacteria group bacterium]